MPSDAAPKLATMKYLVESVLCTGDRDTVMRIGDQKDFGKPYALKVVKREEAADDVRIACARAAAEASPKLGHPAALRYHDFRVRKAWLVVTKRAELLMEFVEGRSLDRLKGLKVPAWAVIFREVAAAVAHMHRRGVIHGDLKPSHVMLSKAGQVKVLGYGLNLVQLKEKGVALGTKVYMAPEQARERTIDEKADVFGLGAVMYHLLTGRPFARREEGDGKAAAPAAINREVPAELSNLVVSTLSGQREKRPEDMTVVRDRLEAIARGLGADEGLLKGLAPAEVEA